jgi:hypothetical protein
MMPYYKFKRGRKEWEEFLSISARTKFLEDNPDVTQLVNGFPKYSDTVTLGRTKPADGFKELLTEIKKKNIHSKMNTFK